MTQSRSLAVAFVLSSALIVGVAGAGEVVLPPHLLKKQVDKDASAGTSASGSTTAPATIAREERARLADLRKAALGADSVLAMQAIEELAGMGAAAKTTLADVVAELLVRDRSAAERGAARAAADARELKTVEAEVAAIREAAAANLAKLAKDETLKTAHEHLDKLKPLITRLNELYAPRAAVVESMERRARLKELWAQAGSTPRPGSRPPITADSEQRLEAAVQKAFGVPAADLVSSTAASTGAKGLSHYRLCRQVEAYNAAIAMNGVDAGELENLVWVNGYREMLGLPPYELDLRLVQSARRHSKAMVELDFFSHDSPVSGNRSAGDRMENAGYAARAGWGENIAYGNATGEGTFMQWFDSPGHHQNMINPSAKAIGIGKWNNHWTQNFGSAERLMHASPETRQAAKITGDPVPAQTPVKR